MKAEPPLYNQSCKWRRSLLCEHDRFVVESRCQEIEYLKFDSYRHQTDDFRRLRRLPFNVKSMKHTQSASRVRSRRNKWRTRCSLILSEAPPTESGECADAHSAAFHAACSQENIQLQLFLRAGLCNAARACRVYPGRLP